VADRPLQAASTAQINHLLTHPISPTDTKGAVVLAVQLAAVNELIQRGQGDYDSLMQLDRLVRLHPHTYLAEAPPDKPLLPVQNDINYLRQASIWGLALLNASQNPGRYQGEAVGLEAYDEVLRRPREDASVQTAVAQAARTLIRPDHPFDPALRRVFVAASRSPISSVAEQGQAGLAAYPLPLKAGVA
jgi:hypothetical protein